MPLPHPLQAMMEGAHFWRRARQGYKKSGGKILLIDSVYRYKNMS